jgi:hypothetical protein
MFGISRVDDAEPLYIVERGQTGEDFDIAAVTA